jgi:hypothetical protein
MRIIFFTAAQFIKWTAGRNTFLIFSLKALVSLRVGGFGILVSAPRDPVIFSIGNLNTLTACSILTFWTQNMQKRPSHLEAIAYLSQNTTFSVNDHLWKTRHEILDDRKKLFFTKPAF